MSSLITYRDFGNVLDSELLVSDQPASLADVTRIVLNFGNYTIDSDTSPTLISWELLDATWVVTAQIGLADIPAGTYSPVWLIVYEPQYQDGLVWVDDLSITIRSTDQRVSDAPDELTQLRAILANGATQIRQADGSMVTYDLSVVAARIRQLESITRIAQTAVYGPRFITSRFGYDV